MDDLIAFWRARLDEAERIAQAAGGDHWADTGDVVSQALAEGDYGPRGYWVASASFACEGEAEPLHDGHAAHIAANDPASVLTDIAADRKLLDMYEEQPGRYLPKGVGDGRDPEERECDAAIKAVLEAVARIRVARFASHPGYREEWRP